MEKHPSVTILAVFAILAIGAFSLIVNHGKVQNSPYSPALPAAKADLPKESSVGSPDGKATITMKEEKGKENSTFTFRVTNSADGSQKEIFAKTEPIGTTLSIPANTFSPDDKYLFLKEIASGETHYLVFSASGVSLTKNGQELEISSLFEEKNPNLKITDATGWGGMTLIIFNTEKKDGGQGPSFWFEVTSHSFIQLSSLFN
jgi:hypothetical protein